MASKFPKSAIEQVLGIEKSPPFHEWVEGIILDNRPFSYDRHEYLREPYADNHPFMNEIKATQMGLTTKAMLKAFYEARYGPDLRGILYLFPSRTDVTEFSKGRVSPLIDDNPNTIGTWLKDTDSANIKRVWNTLLYFRGMKSKVGLKGIPVDFTIVDELDEAPQEFVFWAKKRMSHSELGRFLKLSNPTLPDYGIDLEFQASDQRWWLLKCSKCNHYTDLVDTFPECLITLKDGRTIRACEKCHNELNPSIGIWVAKKPSITDIRGYQYSQLWSHFVKPADILDEFRTVKIISHFWNLTIGLAHVEAENRLTVEQVLALCGDCGFAGQDIGPCSMGVDQRGVELHVVIGKTVSDVGAKLVNIGIYKDWEELDPLMKAFHVSRCVVDALPEQRNSRAFAERHKGRVFLNFYNEHQKGSYAWNERDLIVQCNRTESLDASHKEIMDRNIILPKECDIVRKFAKQLHNTAKKLEEEEKIDTHGNHYKTGNKRYIYVPLGDADHFRHAYNYECMARQYGETGFFGTLDLS